MKLWWQIVVRVEYDCAGDSVGREKLEVGNTLWEINLKQHPSDIKSKKFFAIALVSLI
jgi:hypothetical protein